MSCGVGVEVEVDMGMKAKEEIAQGKEISPLIAPLACSLHSSHISTHCYACFRVIEKVKINKGFVNYCSKGCADVDLPIYKTSGEEELLAYLHENPLKWPSKDFTIYPDHSYIRLALRLLHLMPHPPNSYSYQSRVFEFKWINEEEFEVYVIIAGELIGSVIRRDYSYVACERIFVLVMINALSVSFNVPLSSPVLGIALYDYRLSWVNHSCQPNSRVTFVYGSQPHTLASNEDDMLMEPFAVGGDSFSSSQADDPARCKVSDFLKVQNCGPRACLKAVKSIQTGEQLTICYIYVSKPSLMTIRKWELWIRYRIKCTCRLCTPYEYEDEFSMKKEKKKLDKASREAEEDDTAPSRAEQIPIQPHEEDGVTLLSHIVSRGSVDQMHSLENEISSIISELQRELKSRQQEQQRLVELGAKVSALMLLPEKLGLKLLIESSVAENSRTTSSDAFMPSELKDVIPESPAPSLTIPLLASAPLKTSGTDPSSKVSTNKNRNYAVVAGVVTLLGATGWYLKDRPQLIQ